MIMVISFAAFQATKSLTDLLVLFAVGILGVMMRRFGWSRPAFLIGFVLATTSETYLYQALQFYDWGFLTRTGVIIIGVIIVLSVWAGARSKLTETPTIQAEIAQQSIDEHVRNRTGQIVFLGLMTLAFVFCALDGFKQSFLGGVFTRGIGVVGLVLCAFLAYDLIGRKKRNGAWFDLEHSSEYRELGQWGLWAGMMWVVALSALTAIVGFVLAIVIFFVAFLRQVAGKSWLGTLIMSACAIAAMLTLGKVLNLDFPGGVLQSYLELPWPFR
jgi:hypothetical protein